MGNLLSYVPAIVIVFIAVFSFFYYFAFRLAYLVIVAFFMWIINKVIGAKLKFGELFKISLHTMTLPLIIDIVVTKVFMVEIPFSWWFLILNLGFAILVLTHLVKENKPKVAKTAKPIKKDHKKK